MRLLTAALAVAAATGIAHADCKDPQSNAEMKMCAAQDFEKADAELNVAYVKAIAEARRSYQSLKGSPGTETMPDSEAILRDAQRAWVAFRDANCKYQYQVYWGGTHAPLAYMLCKVSMTQERTKELRQLPGGEEFEN